MDRWYDALRPDGTAFYNDKEMELYVRRCNGHSRPVELEPMGRPLHTEKQVYRQQEPDYDLPSSTFTSASISPDPTSNTRTTASLSRRRTPWNRIERAGRSARSRSHSCSMLLTTTRYTAFWSRELSRGRARPDGGRVHVHPASIDDVILDDEPSKAALTHAPGGRDALLILGFLKNNRPGIRLTEERTALSEVARCLGCEVVNPPVLGYSGALLFSFLTCSVKVWKHQCNFKSEFPIFRKHSHQENEGLFPRKCSAWMPRNAS